MKKLLTSLLGGTGTRNVLRYQRGDSRGTLLRKTLTWIALLAITGSGAVEIGGLLSSEAQAAGATYTLPHDHSALYAGGALGNVTAGDVTAGTVNATGNSVEVDGVSPRVILDEDGAAADNGVWYLLADSETLALRSVSDDRLTGANALTIQRTGTAVDQVAITGGLVVSSAGIISGTADFTAAKNGTESVANSTSVQSDDDLVATLEVGHYAFRMLAVISSPSAADFRFRFSGSAATDVKVNCMALADGGTVQHYSIVESVSTSIRSVSTLDSVTLQPQTTLTCEGGLEVTSAGTFALQWAQNTANATATIVNDTSYIHVRKLIDG